MPLYALTIFVSAFLLFLLQLITAKQILPWFGGSAAVWTTCLVFFQSVLLFGYAYSDWSVRHLTPKRQAIVHVVLLALSLALLPIMPDVSWKPGGAEDPAWHILALLTVTIGLPYFLLSTTSPLIQAWFARTYPDRSPYRLFALSNLASMLALLAYPLAIEPWFTTTVQAQTWSVIYAVFVILCGATAFRGQRTEDRGQITEDGAQKAEKGGRKTKGIKHNPLSSVLCPLSSDPLSSDPSPQGSMLLLWVALAAMGSFLLLAVSNYLTQDISSVPLLWVLPLAIYLLTFILCFDGRGWYRRNLFLGLVALFLCAMAWWLAYPYAFHGMFSTGRMLLMFQIGMFSVGLFVACMFCHGELNRLRPAPCHLTRFYLMISLGGALGALLVGIIAPLVLPGFYELGIGLALLAALGLVQVRERKPVILGIGVAVLLFTGGGALYTSITFTEEAMLTTRNFYGVLRVLEADQDVPDRHRRALAHGATTHGEQFVGERLRRTPTGYYRTASGIGRTLRALHQPNARVGLIGMGPGVIAAYGRPGDTYRFYEINPAVIQIANREFTYLKDSAANIETVLGDARLNLEREPGQKFDVLVVDAFSSDAIPLHLLTREALAVYLKHLQPHGVIAFHITNQFFDFSPVLQRLAIDAGLKAAYVADNKKDGTNLSNWMLLTQEQGFLDLPHIQAVTVPIQSRPDWRLWTDDFNNLVQVLK